MTSSPPRGTIAQVAELIGPGRRGRWVLVVAGAVVVSLVEVAAALMTLLLLKLVATPDGDVSVPLIGSLEEQFPDTSRAGLVTGVAVATGVFFALRAVVLLVQAYIQNRVVFAAGAELSTRLMRGYLRQPYSFHLNRSSSELIRNAYTSVSEVVAHFFLPAIALTADLCTVLGIVAVLTLNAPLATALVVLFMTPLIVALLRGVQPRLSRLGEQSQTLFTTSLALMQQSFEGARDVKLLGREQHFSAQFAEARRVLAKAQYSRALLSEVPRVAVETSLFLFIVTYMVISVRQSGNATEGLAVLGIFAYAAVRLLPSLNRVVQNLNSMKYGAAALREVQRDLRVVGELGAEGQEDVPVVSFEKDVVLENVSFRYDAAGALVLDGIDLTIERGLSLGLVGPTGAGKSTLVDVFLGLLSPTSGRVLVDGRDLNGLERGWQSLLGVVPQSVFMLDDTLRRNIALGIDDAVRDDEAVARAVRLAQLEDFVRELPLGLDTVIGERGVRLSGGQRQRIAIARALYREPSVLVFDEGTSALDNLTEAEFVAALERLKGERTIVTIAHRLSTVRNCDRILVIDRGLIAESGTYDELMTTSPRFRSMAG